jgi:hypothetical protein
MERTDSVFCQRIRPSILEQGSLIMPYYLLAIALLAASTCHAQSESQPNLRVLSTPEAPPSYTVFHSKEVIKIDGHLDEKAWQLSPPITFVMPWNDAQREGSQGTKARLLWDEVNLYIAYECVDPYLDSEVTKHDGPVYNEDAVEIFATPNAGDIGAYFGYEMNINGALLDYIAFGGGSEWTENIHPSWQSEGVQIATTYTGTLNDHSDRDQSWILEIAIPLANFRHLGGQIPPRDGDRWRAGLNRTAGHKGQFGLWADTHQAKPSFHHSIHFGELIFSSQNASPAKR